MKNRLSILIWLALIGGAFFAGAAWTSRAEMSLPAEPEAKLVAEENTSDNRSNEDTLSNTNTSVREPAAFNGLNPQERANIRLFEESAPSVCYITTTNVRRDYFSRNITEIPRGSGSGFVWDYNGHIITNYHVIQG
ncbi:MAG: serine protease, partial [Phaeodactylibacter sp.]|nr:serine protease [Phaeodactylibacter sp.]